MDGCPDLKINIAAKQNVQRLFKIPVKIANGDFFESVRKRFEVERDVIDLPGLNLFLE